MYNTLALTQCMFKVVLFSHLYFALLFLQWKYWLLIVFVTYGASGSPAVDKVSFSSLICVAEQIGNQVMLRLSFVSNPAVTVTFCSSYLAREACLFAVLVEARFVYWCTQQSSSLVKCLITRCHVSLKGYRATWPVSKWLRYFREKNYRPKIWPSSKLTECLMWL